MLTLHDRFIDPSESYIISPVFRLKIHELLAVLLLGFVTGAAAQLQQAQLFESLTYAALMVVTVVTAVAMLVLTRLIKLRWLMACIAFTAFASVGFNLTGLRAAHFASTALAPALEGKDVVVTGQVMAMPQVGEDGVRFRLAVASAQLNGKTTNFPAQIALGWYSGFGLRPTPAAPALAPARVPVPVDGEPEPPEFLLELQRQPQPLQADRKSVV